MRYKPIQQPRTFKHTPPPQLDYTIERGELNGKRVYTVNYNDVIDSLYSITTVLSCRGQAGIQEWKNAVGEEFARKISSTASTIGTSIHELSEIYLLNEDVNIRTRPNVILYHRFKKLAKTLDRIDNIHCLEKPLFSFKLKLAGTVDCIAEFDNVLSVIDFKTSNKHKYEEEIPHYFAQATAYAIMYHEMYGIKIKQVVIIMSLDGEETLVYTSNVGKHIDYLIETIKMFRNGEND